jgi:hypothetical protein
MALPHDNLAAEVELLESVGAERTLPSTIPEGGRTIGSGIVAKRSRAVRGFAASLLAFALIAAGPALAANCPERPRCQGCGCKGGPGYRGPDKKCVGFRNLDEVCGVPTTTHCIFENAPGTGANRECALAPKRERGGARRPRN